MRYLSYLPLFLLTLTVSYLLPATAQLDKCQWIALSASIETYGSKGVDGTKGEDGKNGQNSDSLTIFSDGSPLTLNLVGRDGENGGNGEAGQAGNCDSQPLDVKTNLQAPSGGNGGNSGNGGNGGNGGILTVYSTNPANLRQIYVNTSGGKGGQSGTAGQGGQGCNCEEPYWTVETCQGKPGDQNYRCTTENFQCFNGRDGVSGISGTIGQDGNVGQLVLINLNKPLDPDQNAATVTLAQLKDRGFTLSKNQWETRQGATALFAPGSVINDQYRALVERQEKSFILIWNAPQSFDKFADHTMTLSLGENQAIDVTIPQNIWIEATTQQQNNLTEFVVYNAILESEAVRLQESQLLGSGTNLQLTITDQADLSNLINTRFKVKYSTTRSDPRFRPVSDYSTKFDGEIPPELVTRNGNIFTLDIGKLPIDEGNFRPDLGVEIEITATRSFAGYSATKRMVVRDVLGKFN